MKKRVTQKDLAEHLGLSQAAVSMALRGDPRIRSSIRTRVLEAAEELGYRPDPVMGALAHYRVKTAARRYVGTVACLLPCRPRRVKEYLLSPFAADALRGAEEGLAAMGYRCERFVHGAFPQNHLGKVLGNRGIRGAVIGPVGTGRQAPPRIGGNLAVVQIGRGWPELGFHQVAPNHFDNTRTICQRLRDLGYRRIGLLRRGGQEAQSVDRWIAAYRYYLETEGAPEARPLPVCAGPADIASWMRRHKPDAVIGSDVWLCSLLREKTGLHAPRDIGFASLSVRGPDDAVSGILQQPAEIGRIAARQLDAALRNHEHGPPAHPVTLVMRGRWHQGTTVRTDKSLSRPTDAPGAR